MALTPQDIGRIAHLARLELSESERTKMVTDLSSILGWMEQLNEVDTTTAEPLTHLSYEINAFREDLATNELTTQEALFNAPSKTNSYFSVPKVVE